MTTPHHASSYRPPRRRAKSFRSRPSSAMRWRPGCALTKRRRHPAQDYQQARLHLWWNGGVQRRSARGRFGQPLFRVFPDGDGNRPAGVHLGGRWRRRIFVVTRSGGQLRPQARARGKRPACRTSRLPRPSFCLALRPSAAAGADQGAQLAATCASCHGPAGDDRGIPTIAGLDEQTIMRAMQAFRASEAPSHVMHAVALSLTDEELASVAHYLATQAKKRVRHEDLDAPRVRRPGGSVAAGGARPESGARPGQATRRGDRRRHRRRDGRQISRR